MRERAPNRLIMLLLALLGACVAPPQPFLPPGPEQLADLPGVVAVDVTLSGFERATAVEYAVSAALGARDLPTFFGAEAPAGAHRLTLTRSGGRVSARLADPRGVDLDQFDLDLPDGPGPRLDKAAGAVAERVAAVLAPPDPTLAPVPQARIAVLAAQGAPGDGNEALAEALAKALRGRVPLDDAPNTQGYMVTARVAVQRKDKQDAVALVWLILDPKGREAARLTQANAVPAGSLDRTWGAVATQAAAAAAEALIPVLRELPAEPPP